MISDTVSGHLSEDREGHTHARDEGSDSPTVRADEDVGGATEG